MTHRVWAEPGLLRRYLDSRNAKAGAALELLGEGPFLTCESPAHLDLFGVSAQQGALRLLCDEFDAFGNEVFCRFYAAMPPPERFDLGCLSIPKSGQELCGDVWGTRLHPEGIDILLVDGLGHGSRAAEAGQMALKAFEGYGSQEPAAWIRTLHEALRKSAGAVAAVASIQPNAGRLLYCGVGNIVARICGGEKPVGCISTPGVVGFRLDRVRQESHTWSSSSVLMMHTDGLKTMTDPGELKYRRAPLICASLYRKFGDDRDDCGVVAVRSR